MLLVPEENGGVGGDGAAVTASLVGDVSIEGTILLAFLRNLLAAVAEILV